MFVVVIGGGSFVLRECGCVKIISFKSGGRKIFFVFIVLMILCGLRFCMLVIFCLGR